MIVLFQEFLLLPNLEHCISWTFFIQILFGNYHQNRTNILFYIEKTKLFKNNIWLTTIDNIWIVLFSAVHLYRYPQRK